MRSSDARRISKDRSFTGDELMQVLQGALDANEIDWEKPSPSNALFSMGHYFNSCVSWVCDSGGSKVAPIIAYRILHGFGKYHQDYPFGIKKRKTKTKSDVKFHQEPTMTPLK